VIAIDSRLNHLKFENRVWQKNQFNLLGPGRSGLPLTLLDGFLLRYRSSNPRNKHRLQLLPNSTRNRVNANANGRSFSQCMRLR
jgi:hypothetical protein